jgi:hypothetical protein
MRSSGLVLVSSVPFSVLLALAGCGDDGGGATTDTDATGTTDAGTTMAPPGTSTTPDPDSSGGGMGSDTGEPPATSDGSTGGTDDGGSSSGTDTAGVDCTALPAAPFDAEELFMPFAGSEDLGFDGAGGLAGKNGGNVRVIDATGEETASYTDMGSAYGLRYRADGTILVAHYMAGVVAAIDTSDGTSTNVLMGVGGVNGLFPDSHNQVWFTTGGGVGRLSSDDMPTPIVTGAEAAGANGVYYDEAREVLFWTNYTAGTIRSMAITAEGEPGPTELVTTIPGTALDGLEMDACGNLYVVHQQGNEIWRVFLDEAGAAVGDAEMILTGAVASNIANAQFGEGEGWDETSLYATGNPGVVYQVPVGVPGA